jgi:DNA-binding transcriptional LysR family regulator
MRLKQIETFYWAAKLGSFVKASKHLNATQSAVSMRVQELETRLGVTLFDRSQRSATLTPDGQALLSSAEETMAAAYKFMRIASDKQAEASYVRLGVVEVVAMTWLPQFIAELRLQYPHIQLDIEIGLSYLLEAKLAAGGLDIAFLPCQLSQSGFVHTPLGSETFRWMCGTSRRDLPHSVTAEEFMSLPIITTSRELQLRSAALKWISDNHVSFRAPLICSNFTVAASMVMAGLGAAFLPLSIYHGHLERGEMRVIRCIPEIDPFDLYVVRPVAATRPIEKAMEDIALPFGEIATQAGMKLVA